MTATKPPLPLSEDERAAWVERLAAAAYNAAQRAYDRQFPGYGHFGWATLQDDWKPLWREAVAEVESAVLGRVIAEIERAASPPSVNSVLYEDRDDRMRRKGLLEAAAIVRELGR